MLERPSNRREFLRHSATCAMACTALAGYRADARAQDGTTATANDRPLIGCIGVGGRGSADAQSAARFGDIVAVCDADLRHADQVKTKFAPKATLYQDYRKLLERGDIDVIVNATPDHWHTRINIDACHAGKDVYAEKPLTLTIDEGKILSRVVSDTGRIVQVGTQQRSEKQFQTAVELVRNGRVGKLQQVWVALPFYSTKGGPFATTPIPQQLDWELYQGQAPLHEYCVQRTHSNFRWWYEYAGGITTDWGNHHMDIAHWGMNCEQSGPVSINARGLFPNEGNASCYNTADRFFARMRYPNGVELLYFSALNDRQIYGTVEKHAATPPAQVKWLFGKDVPDEIVTFNRNGIMFIGDKGRVFVNRGGIYGTPAEQLANDPLPENAWRVQPSSDHMGNFFASVKSRKQPVSTVQLQHRTITACHLTNISLRLGRPIRFDPKAQHIVDDAEAAAMEKRKQRAPYDIHA